MKSVFDSLLTANIRTKNYYQTRRLYMTNVLLLIMSLAMSLMAILNLMVFDNVGLALFDLFAAAVPAYAFYCLRKDKNIQWAASVGAYSIFLVTTAFILFNQNQNFGIIWSIFLPIFAMTLLDEQQGLRVTLTFYALMVVSVFWGIGIWQDGEWNFQSAVRYSIALAALIFIVYTYERSLRRYNESEEKAQAKLERLSSVDYLTQLYNRRAISAELQKEIDRFERYQAPFSIVVVDLDNFKKINDTYGHNSGDIVLKGFADALKEALRRTEVVGRWGGEEFLIIFPNTSDTEAAGVLEKLRLAMESKTFGEVEKVTACFGVAEYQPFLGAEGVVAKADKALYLAKQTGKNKVLIG